MKAARKIQLIFGLFFMVLCIPVWVLHKLLALRPGIPLRLLRWHAGES